jgi:hypothetical protein
VLAASPDPSAPLAPSSRSHRRTAPSPSCGPLAAAQAQRKAHRTPGRIWTRRAPDDRNSSRSSRADVRTCNAIPKADHAPWSLARPELNACGALSPAGRGFQRPGPAGRAMLRESARFGSVGAVPEACARQRGHDGQPDHEGARAVEPDQDFCHSWIHPLPVCVQLLSAKSGATGASRRGVKRETATRRSPPQSRAAGMIAVSSQGQGAWKRCSALAIGRN